MDIGMLEGARRKNIEVFCCYAHEDQRLLFKLKTHLMPLQRERLITLWADVNINAGVEWKKEIDRHLYTARIILLLISPDFMASEYCYSVEMQRAMERHERDEARVIPIILRPTSWQGAPFGKLQVLPANASPITEWHHQDKAFYTVAEGIRAVVEALAIKNPAPQVHSPDQAREDVADISFPPGQRNRPSYPRITLIALIGQILLAVDFTLEMYFVIHPHGNPDILLTSMENLLVFIIIFLFLGGAVCSAIAFGMSLSKAKQLQRWGWFTGLIIGFVGLFILFLSPLIPLLFGLFGPKARNDTETPLPVPPGQRNRPSYPRITLIALIGQILLIAAFASLDYNGAKYGSESPATLEYTLLLIINIFTSLGGVVCAAIAFGMSLSKAKQLQRRGWFTGLIIGFVGLFILFLSPLIPLLFGLFGPKEQRAAQTRN